jgi:hypothetical protein
MVVVYHIEVMSDGEDRPKAEGRRQKDDLKPGDE